MSKILVALGAAVVSVPAPAAALVVADWRRGLSATVAAAVYAARSWRHIPIWSGVECSDLACGEDIDEE